MKTVEGPNPSHVFTLKRGRRRRRRERWSNYSKYPTSTLSPCHGQEGLKVGISDNRLVIKFLIILSRSIVGPIMIVKYGSEVFVYLSPNPNPS